MNRIVLAILALTILAVSAVFFFVQRVEGFENRNELVDNALVSLMGNLKRISGYLVNPVTWSERIDLMYLTPTELARRHINSQANVE
jgi:hypothetical protein